MEIFDYLMEHPYLFEFTIFSICVFPAVVGLVYIICFRDKKSSDNKNYSVRQPYIYDECEDDYSIFGEREDDHFIKKSNHGSASATEFKVGSSYGRINSNGSGYYYGSDGSYGHFRNGQGTYYGPGGRYGTIRSDGSATFMSSKGDFAHKNSNGSFSHFGRDSVTYRTPDGKFHHYGTDGSIGYTALNGKTYYYGSDGSYGCMNKDGSGTFYGGIGRSIFDDDDF